MRLRRRRLRMHRRLSLPSIFRKPPSRSHDAYFPLSLFVEHRRWIPPDFDRDCIRLLVFSDSDDTGLQLIFDSKTLRIVVPTDNENPANKPVPTNHSHSTLSAVPTASVSANDALLSFFSHRRARARRDRQINRRLDPVAAVVLALVRWSHV